MGTAKVKTLIRASEKVITAGSLDNGAIVAAGPGGAVYPSTVQDYGYVWVRDAAYICIAADLLGRRQIAEKFFDWCLNRAEGFRETGLLYNAYSANGVLHGTLIPPKEVKVTRTEAGKYAHLICHGTQFQPDQNGTLLLAIKHHLRHFSADAAKFAELITVAAGGICSSWKQAVSAVRGRIVCLRLAVSTCGRKDAFPPDAGDIILIRLRCASPG